MAYSKCFRKLPYDHRKLLVFCVKSLHALFVGEFQNQKDRPIARYTAAELGGSYVVSLCEAAKADVTGQIFAIGANSGTRQSGDHDREMAQEKRSKVRAAITAVCDEIFEIYESSLRMPSFHDWRAFWVKHRDDLEDKISTLHSLAKIAGLEKVTRRRDEDERGAGGIIADADHELRFLRGMAESAYKRVSGFGGIPVPADSESKDFEYAASFHHYGISFQICMSTLDYVSCFHKEVSRDFLAWVFEFARHSALELTHFSMEAAALRRKPEPPVDVDPGEAISISDADLVDVEMTIRSYESGATA